MIIHKDKKGVHRMTEKQQQLAQNILTSQGKVEADFILRNAQVADVFTLTWKKADIVVKNGQIVALDTQRRFTATQEEDAAGKLRCTRTYRWAYTY